MSIDHISQNIQIEEILRQSREELQWGDYSDQTKIDVFEVWTIRDNYEINRHGSYTEYEEAVAASELMVLIMTSPKVSPIVRSIVVCVQSVVVVTIRS